MTAKTAKLNNLKSKTTKKPRMTRGRKPAGSVAKKRRTTPGRGAALLRSSVNTKVGEESDRIANALVENTVAGNMTGARLLVELTGADKPPVPKKKKRRGPSLVDFFKSQPQWTEEDEARLNHDASGLGPSEPGCYDSRGVAEFNAPLAGNEPVR
jgi:hypothetical protein